MRRRTIHAAENSGAVTAADHGSERQRLAELAATAEKNNEKSWRAERMSEWK